jgi:hypothetical protein
VVKVEASMTATKICAGRTWPESRSTITGTVAVSLRMALDVVIPQHRQSDVLAPELAMDLGPIGLRVAAMTLLGVDRSKECRSSALARNSQLNPALASGFNVNRTAKERTLIGPAEASPSRVK